MKKPGKKILVGMSLLSAAAVLGGCTKPAANEEIQDVYGPPVEDVYEEPEPVETVYGPPPAELEDEPAESLPEEDKDDAVKEDDKEVSDGFDEVTDGAGSDADAADAQNTDDKSLKNGDTKEDEQEASGAGNGSRFRVKDGRNDHNMVQLIYGPPPRN